MSSDAVAALSESLCMNVRSFRKDGLPIDTPVWVVAIDGSLAFFTDDRSFKFKRLRRNPRIEVAPCDVWGKVSAPWRAGVCRLVEDGARKQAIFDLIAKNTTVSLEDLLAFVRPRHRMVLTTFRADGSLQSSPVSGGVDDAGRIVIASYPQRAKSTNIRRTPRASVMVLSDEFNDAYVQVDGDAEVIDLPDAVEPLVDYFRSIAGEHPDWAEYRQAMVDQGKCLIRVTPRQWGPVATGGFPPPQ